MSEKTFTHKDLAVLLGVSETTVKSYRRKFPGCIPVANKGKPIRFTEEAATVALKIRDYFDTGMSVEDVRARLAQEFSWIEVEPDAMLIVRESTGKGRPDKTSVPVLAQNVSNMARGMVALTQQQNAILSRLEAFESLLAEGGAQNFAVDTAKRMDARTQAAQKHGEEIEARLDQLDANTRELANTVASLSRRLDRFLDTRDKAAEDWREESAQTLATAARIAAETIAPQPPNQQDAHVQAEQAAHTEQTGQAEPAGHPGLSAHDEQTKERAQVISFQDSLRPHSDLVPTQPDAPAGPAEPPRQFFSLPLMVCTEDGQYMSAGGKSRGRFSLNDLKAMLIYGFTPPNHFSLRWERHGQGWWLHLEQDTSDRNYRLLLMELPSHKGGTVAEILQLKSGDETMHPVQIWGIIDSFAE
ncbi:helix-turn-helix domain-containing protein [Desulfovibrio sp. OttesenSCG-928-G15]|nr:helix-turn-helix domain-containing protein [Desulfovibrio sp. OttesenSCG-928-G15]